MMKLKTCEFQRGALVVAVLLLSVFVDPVSSKSGNGASAVVSPEETLKYTKTVAAAKEAAQHGDNERAVKLLGEGLAISQADPSLYVNLGDALFALKRYPQAA